MGAASLLRLGLLALLWGSNFLWIALALDGFGPAQILAGRLVLGAAVLLAILTLRRLRLPRTPAVWRHLAVAALIGNVVPYYLFAWAEQTIPSSLAGVLNATTPLWTTALALLIGQERRAGVDRAVGLVLGFAGVVVVLSPWRLADAGGVAGQLAALGASACYGLTFVYQRRNLTGRGEAPLVLAAGQMTVAAGLVLLAAPLLWTPVDPPPTALLGLLALGVSGTGLAYALHFRLVADEGATNASTVTYLLPVVAVTLGAVVLGEPIAWGVLVGAGVVLTGIALVHGRLRLPRVGPRRDGSRRPAVAIVPAAPPRPHGRRAPHVHTGRKPTMADVQILSANETSDGYRFDVAIDEAGHHTRHEVSLSATDYQRWSEEGASPQAVARRCVELLVERVQQDDLMERFDLREALQFYPAFEEEIHRRME